MPIDNLNKAFGHLMEYVEDDVVGLKRPNLRYAVLDAKNTLERKVELLRAENKQLERELGISPSQLTLNYKDSTYMKCQNCKENIMTDTQVEPSSSGCCFTEPRRETQVLHTCPVCGALLGSYSKQFRDQGVFKK